MWTQWLSGYVAITRMVGGATEGYCATGNCVMDTMPAMITKIAITQARWVDG